MHKSTSAKRTGTILTWALLFFSAIISSVMAENEKSNRLANEKSPYLLQHANNPVDWYPWGPEAFAKARNEDKPIFLSVGYSTCHWCHVMEEESFENTEIAKVLNAHFVAVKVDREERPDVDAIYMASVQLATGSGGWPMSVFLDHELRPFYGGTYFPPDDRWGRPGFMTVISTISEKWKTARESLLTSSMALHQAVQEQVRNTAAETKDLNEQVLRSMFEHYEQTYDRDHGGFGQAPKFPRSHALSALLRYWKRSGNEKALEMVEETLRGMSEGGMYDHLSGGFHRYSVDAEWRVPHFEKMLYDQALLVKTLLEVHQITKSGYFSGIAQQTLDYVIRFMTDKKTGGFYSAEDADSAMDLKFPKDKAEGAFYVWSHREIEAAIGKEKAEIFNFVYDIQPKGNIEHDPHGEFPEKNVLYKTHSLSFAAKKFEKDPKEIQKILQEAKDKLLEVRAVRPRPHLDDKVLTDWNGLMIGAFAMAARVLGETEYLKVAKRAADFMLSTMQQKDGTLLHRYRKGEAGIEGFLEDYAFLADGLFELHQASQDPHYLNEAIQLCKKMQELFWDESAGGFFFTEGNNKNLIARNKPLYDGATPSGNSVAAYALLRIGRLTMNKQFEVWAEETLNAFSSFIAERPMHYTQALLALDFALGPSREIVIAGEESDGATVAMFQEIHLRYLPNSVFILHPNEGKNKENIEKLSPFAKNQNAMNGKATAYVCSGYQCKFPTTDLEKFKKLLEEVPVSTRDGSDSLNTS